MQPSIQDRQRATRRGEPAPGVSEQARRALTGEALPPTAGTTKANRIAERGFTRADLLAMIAVVMLLTGGLGWQHWGERGRSARCAQNLHFLGKAMQEFASDHGAGLPAATIASAGMNWDMELMPYMKLGYTNLKSTGARIRMKQKSAPRLVCPFDNFPRGYPRSYAMPAHDMQLAHWPPDGNTATGVGLWWEKGNIQRLLGPDMVEKAAANPEVLPRIKLSLISAPADTLLLTDLIRHDNTVGGIYWTIVNNAGEQHENQDSDARPFHGGRFNYLMLDGHVESLTGLQAGGDIWSMGKGN